MDRRKFTGVSALGSLLLLLPAWASCTWTDVYATLQKALPALLKAFSAILDILIAAGVIPASPGGVILMAILKVKAGFADLSQAIADYLKAAAANKPTFLGKLVAALQTVQADIVEFWNNLSIPSPAIAALVQSLLGIILGTLAGYAQKLQPAIHSMAMPFPVAPKARDEQEFRNDFNALLPAPFEKYAL